MSTKNRLEILEAKLLKKHVETQESETAKLLCEYDAETQRINSLSTTELELYVEALKTSPLPEPSGSYDGLIRQSVITDLNQLLAEKKAGVGVGV